MNPRHNGDPHFRVQMSAVVADQLRRILRRAAAVGRAADVVEAARQIRHHLRTRPREFGELTRHYPAAQLDLRRGAVGPLFVYYGVHRTQPQVFIREFRDSLTTS
jgi:hypothetical protein